MNTPRRSLSVVIPVYNEKARIARGVEGVHRFLLERGYDGEILVVDDGSKDDTLALAHELAKSHPLVRVLSYGRNQGAGYAVRTGILAATREAILYTDVDLSTPIEDIDLLWPWYDRGYDIVMASRHLVQSKMDVLQPLHRRVLGKAFRMIISLLCVRGFRDTQCGFKLFRTAPARRIFPRVKSRRFTFNVEMLMYAKQLGQKIAEVPVRWNDVAGTRISVLKEGIRTLVEVLRIRGLLPRR